MLSIASLFGDLINVIFSANENNSPDMKFNIPGQLHRQHLLMTAKILKTTQCM